MFKFNFDIDEKNEQAEHERDKNPNNGSLDVQENMDIIKWHDSKEVIPTIENFDSLDMYRLNAKEIQIGSILLMYMMPKFVLDSKMNENIDIKTAEESHSDLIPGIYEGGAKLWECTLDLLDYFKENQTMEWNKKRVLDLGCGCGLLGIYALKQSAIVHFQDYNEDVLQNITIPNVLLNLNEDLLNATSFSELSKNMRFYSGDWSKYVELSSKDELFDCILTSETIYNPENQKKLLQVFASKLNTNGKVYVAAKSYYFGVGGNIKQFQDLIKIDNRFKCKTVWTSKDGVKREILELVFLKTS